ncbi:RHS repeat domain-containing protein, partial [Polyangium fumosum]
LAQEELYHNSELVEPVWKYEYDAIYRLIEATGREHSGQNADIQQDQNGFPLVNAANPNDPQAMRNYAESFEYDAVGNILKMIHAAQGSTGSWTRRYDIETMSNRLLGTSLPGDDEAEFSATYTYDEHGSMTSMPHLDGIEWDFKDQKREVDKGGGGTVYVTYDAGGQRVRKVWEHSGIVEERIYLGGFEVYRRHELGSVVLERETLHVMDDARRIAMVETKTVDTNAPPFTPTPRLRYQFGNHLGSASLEVDEAGLVIGYEEYHPYGTTAYHAAVSGVEVSAKRYRYTGKERDEETGLYYHGARYYAPWLGRWTSADPAGMVDGANLYEYVRGAPTRLVDSTGNGGEEATDIDGLFLWLRGMRHKLSAEMFARLIGANEVKLHPLLSEYGYQGSKAKPEDTVRDFDRAFASWSKLASEANSRDGFTGPSAPGDAQARQRMWQVAASNPIAAAFIGTGAFISETVGKTFGFEQDPNMAAAGAEVTTQIVHSTGGAGVNRATQKKPNARTQTQAKPVPKGLLRARTIAGGKTIVSPSERPIVTLGEGESAVVVSELPGERGMFVPRRLTDVEMRALQKEFGLEFALIYRTGQGKGGGGGTYWLYSGKRAELTFPILPNVRLISHTHPPEGVYGPSSEDVDTIKQLRKAGSPQFRSNVVEHDGEVLRFGVPRPKKAN